jgi:SAM-dependent methyltransferase
MGRNGRIPLRASRQIGGRIPGGSLDGGGLMTFNSPMGIAKAEQIIQLLELQPGNRAFDAGCGIGEFLLRVDAAHPIYGVGVDQDPRCISVALESAASRGLSSRCEFRTIDVNELATQRGEYDLGICIGSTHAFGSGEAAYPITIKRLCDAVRPGGLILIGEGYWKREPAAEYLKLIGDPVGIYRDHAENISLAEERGLLPLYATCSNDDEWDHFEWSHQLKVRRLVEASPTDPALVERFARARQWRDGYLRWGRSTMGFGMYLFRTPAGAT